MKFLAIIFVAAFAASSACAGSVASPCRTERLTFAKSACLELIFDQRLLQMSQQIDDVLSRLQAATATELLQLGRQYLSAQSTWIDDVERACDSRYAGEPVAYQTCRLGALPRREERLTLSLERAAEDFGAPVEYRIPIPDAVEILIPLPVPLPLGGEARLPLLVPIHPK